MLEGFLVLWMKGKSAQDVYYLNAYEFVSSNGPKWHRKRKMLTPVFHFNILEEFVPAMNEQAALLADILLEQKGKDIDIFNYLGKCTLNIICGRSKH